MSLRVDPLTPERWADFVELFSRPGPRGGGGPGAGSGCWCMWWRDRGAPEANRGAMERLVADGARPGLLAYEDAVPVGWLSIAPRNAHRRLMRSRTYAPSDTDPDVWAIVCVYVHPAARKARVASALLDAAVAFAHAAGAAAIEAYPATDEARSDYMGRIDAFERRGFAHRDTRGTRTVMRLVF
jgi:GNAT superfamily N-acetyltransferase